MLKIGALGSGSGGNALVIDNGVDALLVDAGFSRREMLNRLEAIELSPSRVRAVLVTHEHTDHIKGCRVFCDNLGIPMYASSQTARILGRRGELPGQVREFMPGDRFPIHDFLVHPFPVQHDAMEPVGFVVSTSGGEKIGVATDIGEVNSTAKQELFNCDALVLESNYDAEMLRNSPRRLELKRRIAGRHGHLDNRDTCAALGELLGERTKLLLLAHVSRECNQPVLVEEGVRAALLKIGRASLHFEVLRQECIRQIFELE